MNWLERIVQKVEQSHQRHARRRQVVKSSHRSKGVDRKLRRRVRKDVRSKFVDDEALEVLHDESDPIPELGFIEQGAFDFEAVSI